MFQIILLFEVGERGFIAIDNIGKLNSVSIKTIIFKSRYIEI